jgi:TrmH family RNA methyltransferase
LNIGAAARAMANFGFSDLFVVKPYAPVWRETVSAVGAEKLVLEAKAVPSLEDAVRDCHLVLGTTTTRRRRLEKPVIRLPELFSSLRKRLKEKGKVALLFGPEKTGLSNRYLDRCHAFLTVPTDDACPSMNLSHAVAVCCYELSRQKRFGPKVPALEIPLARAGEVEQLTRHALEVFKAASYLDFLPEAERRRKIRRTFLHWRLRRRDLALLHGVFRYILRRLENET